jgi:hypothetical protein
MEKKETTRAMPPVQLLDAADRDVEILRVFRMTLLGASANRSTRQAQVRIRIAEITNFQAVSHSFSIAAGVVNIIGTYHEGAAIRDAFLSRRTFSPAHRGRRIEVTK